MQQLLSAATSLVVKSFDPKLGFTESINNNTAPLITMNAAGRAIVAGALGRLLKHGYANQQLTDSFVRLALDTAWNSVLDHQQVMMLPWLGWGEDDLALATGEQPITVTSHLISLRQLLHNSIIGARAPIGPLDLQGGFALGGSNRKIATAQSLRPTAYLATMLGNPKLTPPDLVEVSLDKHLQTMRFAMQLAIRDTSAWFLRNPSKAIGGVRNGISDVIQPVPAQALGLLSASETLKSLKNLPQGQKNNNL